MSPKPKITIVMGTRPEVIKLAPIINLMCKKDTFDVFICSTGQHREMLNQTLMSFEITSDINLDLMTRDQSLSEFTSRALVAIDGVFNKIKPDAVIVQGDTTTTFVASLVAFYNQIPIGHVEAGLRTYNKFNPFPEEINRKITGSLADWHFAPTEQARKTLLNEGVNKQNIWVTGNSFVDAIEYMKKISMALPKERFADLPVPIVNSLFVEADSKIILITCHRRENFGVGLSNICEAIQLLASEFYHHNFVFPVHFNPNVRKQVFNMLAGLQNVFLIDPIDYKRFVRIMASAEIILTDSGGIQEEVFSLSVPTLVMRKNTERGEGLNLGDDALVKLIGVNRDDIVNGVKKHFNRGKTELYSASNPYGDGLASQRINDIIEEKMMRNNDRI